MKIWRRNPEVEDLALALRASEVHIRDEELPANPMYKASVADGFRDSIPVPKAEEGEPQELDVRLQIRQLLLNKAHMHTHE